MALGQPVIGTYTGTGAAINIPVGFVPDHVRVFNITDGNLAIEWMPIMGAGTGIDAIAGTSKVTANGISAFAGVAGTTPPGFTAGTAYSLSGKVFGYIASCNA